MIFQPSDRLHLRSTRGFSLADVLIAVTLSSFLVFLIAQFFTDVLQMSSYVARHQLIRQESLALVNNVLPSVIREAVAIDYVNTNEHQLTLFMDKFERTKIQIAVDKDTASLGEGRSQLVIKVKEGDQERSIFLNSERTYVTAFDVQTTSNPASADSEETQQQRAFQPMVEVTVRSRYQRDFATTRSDFGFLEDPRIAYTGLYTLRNYSFSNLRQ